MPLKNRNVQIPNGFSYLQPETAWIPMRFSSFNSVVDQVIQHRLANPHLIHQNGWSTDRATVEAEVDNYNSKVCAQMGWTDYLEGGGPMPVPFPQPGQIRQAARSLLNAAAGSAALVDFIGSREEAVPDELANQRAATCAACPLNTKGNWLSRFTVPVSNAIRIRLEERRGMKLSTPQDAQLGVCDACDCPLPLMIHFPLETKLNHMTKKALASLDSGCWIRAEMKKQNE